MKRMRRYDPVNKHDAQIEHRLHGMHGHARPGIGINVFMVEIMHGAVERLPVNETMHPVKMKFAPERDEEKPEHKVTRVAAPFEARDVVIGVEPEGADFISRPDEAGHAASPKNIVVHLVAKKEQAAVTSWPVGVIFSLRAFAFENIKMQVVATVVEPHKDQIPDVNLTDPVGGKLRTAGDIRLREEPRNGRDREQEDIDGPQKSWIAHQPAADGSEAQRPNEERCVTNWVGRAPFPFRVARGGGERG